MRHQRFFFWWKLHDGAPESPILFIACEIVGFTMLALPIAILGASLTGTAAI